MSFGQSTLLVPSQYSTIQAAINTASNGDTILVYDGTYLGTYEFPIHTINLVSVNGPAVTILDGNQAETVITISGNNTTSLIRGFTITGGYAYQHSTSCNGKMGGGIEVCNGAKPIIENNIVRDNLGRHRGGGIMIQGLCEGTIIRRNLIINNTVPQGSSGLDGGAGVSIQSDSVTLINNTICNNNVSGNYNHGAGLCLWASYGVFKNNIIYNNYGGDQVYYNSPALDMEYSNIQQTNLIGIGLINQTPNFVNPSNNDYHLLATSPCIDTGDPLSIYNDPDGTRNDMGCYYFPNITLGCTDSLACNYDSLATIDDGSCIATIYGCTDSTALNYNPLANTDDSTCYYCSISVNAFPIIFPSSPTACDGAIILTPTSGTGPYTYVWSNSNTTAFNQSLCNQVYSYMVTDANGCGFNDTIILTNYVGCTDSLALNYDSTAIVDDGSCIAFVYGCTDSTAINYNPLANTDDGSCIPYVYGCIDSTATNYDSNAEFAAIEENKQETQKMDGYKATCTSLGFKPESEKFADCALKLFVEDHKKAPVVQSSSGGTMTIHDPAREWREQRKVIDAWNKAVSRPCGSSGIC